MVTVSIYGLHCLTAVQTLSTGMVHSPITELPSLLMFNDIFVNLYIRSRSQFDWDIYSLWTINTSGISTNYQSRVYEPHGVACVCLFGRGVNLLILIVYHTVETMVKLVIKTGM